MSAALHLVEPAADLARVRHTPRVKRVCAECGMDYLGSHDSTFCKPGCKDAYHNRANKRGRVAMPLLMAWRAGKGRKGDPVASYAFREACALLDRWNGEDRAAGRVAATEFARRKLASGWKAVDL